MNEPYQMWKAPNLSRMVLYVMMQYTAQCCNTLQHIASPLPWVLFLFAQSCCSNPSFWECATYFNTLAITFAIVSLKHCATRHNNLQHTATHCKPLVISSTLQLRHHVAATYCNIFAIMLLIPQNFQTCLAGLFSQ